MEKLGRGQHAGRFSENVRQVAGRRPSAVLAGHGLPKAGKPVATRSWGSSQNLHIIAACYFSDT